MGTKLTRDEHGQTVVEKCIARATTHEAIDNSGIWIIDEKTKEKRLKKESELKHNKDYRHNPDTDTLFADCATIEELSESACKDFGHDTSR